MDVCLTQYFIDILESVHRPFEVSTSNSKIINISLDVSRKKTRVQNTMLLTWEISMKLIFLLLWLQRQAHVHFDLGFVTFDAFFKLESHWAAEDEIYQFPI